MPRAGLTTDAVVDAAVALADEEGIEALTLSGLAGRFEVKPPSLYNHVAGLEDLRRRVALRAIDELAAALRSSVMGRSGRDALYSLAAAYRTFATSRPGVYPLTQTTLPEDPEYREKSAAAIEPTLAVLAGYGLFGDDAIHATRAVRSALHGFVLLETGGGFGLSQDVDDTFRLLVDMLESSLAQPPGRLVSS